MSQQIYNNFLSIKYLFFIVFLFPFLMHIYWHLFDLIYYNNIIYNGLFLLGFGSFIWIKETNYQVGSFLHDRFFLPFLVFLVFMFINSIILHDFKDFVKYVFYIVLYYVVYKRFESRQYFNLFVNMVVFFSLMSFALYAISQFSDYYVSFNISELTFIPESSSFISRKDWNYSLPFLLSVVPLNADASLGLFGIPRFFGVSTEPSAMAGIVLPTMIMAVYLKKYISAATLFSILLFISSYGAFAILLFGLAIYKFYNIRLHLFYIVVLGIFTFIWQINYFSGMFNLSDSIRLGSYLELVLNISEIKYSLFAMKHSVELSVISAVAFFGLKYGLVSLVSYLWILFNALKEVNISNDRLLLMFTVVFILILNKGGEIISPFFLYCLSFISYVKMNLHQNILKKENSSDL